VARPLLRTEASVHLWEKYGIRRKPQTLAKLAVIGGGPKFRRDGRIPLYDPDDLDAWAEEILTPPAATTAEHDARARRGEPKQPDGRVAAPADRQKHAGRKTAMLCGGAVP
jgi:hypothetical protein